MTCVIYNNLLIYDITSSIHQSNNNLHTTQFQNLIVNNKQPETTLKKEIISTLEVLAIE